MLTLTRKPTRKRSRIQPQNALSRTKATAYHKCWFMAIALSMLASCTPSFLFAEAYRYGDPVDIAVSTRSAVTVDMLIASQPSFGVHKKVHLPRLPERFSLTFEDGLHSLPYMDGQKIQELIVTFVYSHSGDGKIHSVTSRSVPSSARTKDPNINVTFEWVEEASVDLEAGSTIMFLAVFLISVLFFLQLCTMDETESAEDDYDSRGIGRGNAYYKGQ